jgi:hypothetical protein
VGFTSLRRYPPLRLGQDRRHRGGGIVGTVDSRQHEGHRAIFSGWQDAIETEAQRRHIAALRKLYGFAGKGTRFTVQQGFHGQGGGIAAALWLASWVARLAGLERFTPLLGFLSRWVRAG